MSKIIQDAIARLEKKSIGDGSDSKVDSSFGEGVNEEVITEKFGKPAEGKEEPDLHVMYQLRKALHSPVGFDVTFKHGGTARVSPGHAHGALVQYENLKPIDKEKYQKRIEASYEELKRTVQEGIDAELNGKEFIIT
jgi:hypothetical protein